jgi:hypothetical protein
LRRRDPMSQSECDPLAAEVKASASILWVDAAGATPCITTSSLGVGTEPLSRRGRRAKECRSVLVSKESVLTDFNSDDDHKIRPASRLRW